MKTIEYTIVHYGTRNPKGVGTRFEQKSVETTTLLERTGIEIEEDSTIDQLLKKISTPILLDHLGVSEIEGRFFVGDTRLKRDDLINKLEGTEGGVLEIRPFLKLNRTLYLETMGGKIYPIEFIPSMTFEELREIASRKTQISIENILIIRYGRQMKEGDTLENNVSLQKFFIVKRLN